MPHQLQQVREEPWLAWDGHGDAGSGEPEGRVLLITQPVSPSLAVGRIRLSMLFPELGFVPVPIHVPEGSQASVLTDPSPSRISRPPVQNSNSSKTDGGGRGARERRGSAEFLDGRAVAECGAPGCVSGAGDGGLQGRGAEGMRGREGKDGMGEKEGEEGGRIGIASRIFAIRLMRRGW